jgi:hypothetical protein
MNSKGPSNEPCSTSYFSYCSCFSDKVAPILTIWLHLARYEMNHFITFPPNPKLSDSQCNRISWSIVSKAAERSNITNAVDSFFARFK